jgi:RNA polymerase sigma-70 factor (ECF subfamily)
MDLAQILERCQNGDELAWEVLVRQFQSRVYGIAYHYTGTREDARDVAQDVFIRLYQNIDDCKGSDRFIPWMIRIARNACIDFLRRGRVRPKATDAVENCLDHLAASQDNPEQEWFAHSRRRLIHRALQELTELSREIIVLKDIQGLPLEQIAEMLEIPLGTAKSRSNRARLELAQKVLAISQAGNAKLRPSEVGI